MNLASWIIAILFAAAFVAVVRYLLRNGIPCESGGSCKACGKCSGRHCASCAQAEKILQGFRKKS